MYCILKYHGKLKIRENEISHSGNEPGTKRWNKIYFYFYDFHYEN